MSVEDPDELGREIASLRLRVERLEGLVSRSDQAGNRATAASGGDPFAGSAKPGAGPESPALSFDPPARPTLESRIGSQVFNRVGIVAVLIGVAWFLKYAVDEQWLGTLARVLIGLGFGAGLIGWSERFRRKGFPVFSFSLKAVGTGVLYLALWASFALFHLVSYEVALLGMVVVTAGNGWMCWAQRSEVLAAYALTGGFLTPALLGPAQISVTVLGGYLLLLNAGLFALLTLRRWPRLLPAAFAGTISYLLVLGFEPGSLRAQAHGGEALALAGLFFALFSLSPLYLVAADTSARRRIANGTAIANAALGGLALWLLLPRGGPAAHWLPCLLAGWFGILLILERLRRAGEALAAVHAGLVIVLAAVGLWRGLRGGGVVLGWVLEASTLLGLSLRRRAGAVERVLGSPVAPAALLLGASVLLVVESALHMLPSADYVFLNERFALFLLAIAGAVLAVRVAARQHAAPWEGEHAWGQMGAGSALLATVLLLVGGVFEMRTYWGGGAAVAEQFAISAWAALLGVALLILGFRLRWAFLRWQALALLTLAIAKVFLVDTRSLTQGFRIVSFLGLGVLLLCVSFIYQRDLLNLRGKEHGGE